MEHTYGIEQGGNYVEQGWTYQPPSGFDPAGPSTTGVANSRRLGLCHHRSSPGHPARRPSEAHAPNTDRPTAEGKSARSRRDPVRLGSVNARLKYLSFGTRIRYVYDENGASKLRPDFRHIGGNLALPYVHS